jgi:hypothetical protein
MATPGNATSFGSLASPSTRLGCAVGDETYTVYDGGYNGTSTLSDMDYVTTQTLGNMTTFGSLTGPKRQAGGAQSPTTGGTGRGLFAGGYGASSTIASIDYITTATTGNAADFGDLLVAANNIGGLAGSSS